MGAVQRPVLNRVAMEGLQEELTLSRDLDEETGYQLQNEELINCSSDTWLISPNSEIWVYWISSSGLLYDSHVA